MRTVKGILLILAALLLILLAWFGIEIVSRLGEDGQFRIPEQIGFSVSSVQDGRFFEQFISRPVPETPAVTKTPYTESAVILPWDPNARPKPILPPAPAERIPVEFPNTLFIGDSRTDGLKESGGIVGADFFCDTGFSAQWITSQSANVGGVMRSFANTLQRKQYDVIHVSLGINEMLIDPDSFERVMTRLVETIRSYQPNAVIILGANIQITQYNSYKHQNERLIALNERMANVHPDDRVFYLDANEIFAKDGYLCDELSWDGVHFYNQYYPNWSQWLRAEVDEILKEI